MIRVGFLLNFPVEYKGGINYLKNLFYALNKFSKDEVKIVLFVPSNLDQEYITLFTDYAEIIKTKVIQRKSLQWFVSKVGERLFNFDIPTYNLLVKHEIDIVSHSNYIFPGKRIKSINWIPDFQYLHFPDLWTNDQLVATTKLHTRLIIKSNAIVLSSASAFEDFKLKYEMYGKKVSVLNFVSQPGGELRSSLSPIESNKLQSEYSLDRPFFYLPNQFWTHKNHIIVFKAIKILKEKGYNPLLVTSGLMNDYRNGSNHIESLEKFILENNLKENILFLGLIPYFDVLKLMILSKCVVNPSYFEGWSSTVEEAKTMGKLLLLSNIDVHLEQNPSGGVYFSPDNEKELSSKMELIMLNFENQAEVDVNDLILKLNTRTKQFALNYLEILRNCLK